MRYLFGAIAIGLVLYYFWHEVLIILAILAVIAAAIGIWVAISDSQEKKKKMEEEEKKKREKQNCSAVEKRIRTEVYIPVPEGAVNMDNYLACMKMLNRARVLKGKLEAASTIEDKRKQKAIIANFRLLSFYSLSLRNEIGEDELSDFDNRIKQAQENDALWTLRKSDDEDATINGEAEVETFAILEQHKSILEDNNIEKTLESFKKVKARDVSFLGLFTDTSEMTLQTKEMEKLYENVSLEYKELADVASSVNKVLTQARGYAYRNIYLGVELLNCIRDNAGGTGLAAQHDLAETGAEISVSNFSTEDLSINMGAVLSKGLFSPAISGTTFSLIRNPAKILGFGGLVVAGNLVNNLVKAHNKAVEANIDAQRKLTGAMNECVSNYSKCQGQVLRAIEIVKALVHANKGFLSIYAPLRDRAFEQNAIASITPAEAHQLVLAIGEYKKISDSTIQ